MEVRLNPEMEARLADIAAARGCDTEALAREAIERFLDSDKWFSPRWRRV
jgi:predicted transcriptional regulator